MSGHSAPTRRLALVDLLPLLLFALASLWLFRESVTAHQVYYQDDTVTYYLPLARRIDSILDEGRLPLWTPYVFGGHPLFADSESAVLYPPNLLSWLLLSPYAAFAFVRIFRFWLAGAFAYAFGRAIGLTRPGATLVGLVFGFGSFMVGQIHHKNLADASVWLPAILWCVERALQSEGAARRRWWLLGGGAFALQLLTIHVNPVLMTLMLLGLYVAARVFWLDPRPSGAETLRGALTTGASGLAVIGLAGIGVAAIQLVPLYELSTFSFRGRAVDWSFANAFNFPTANLLTLVLPYFFRDPASGVYWSPWFRWNTTLYVGIAPLLLAPAALLAPRRRWTAFFAGVAALGLLLALGANLPLNLFDLLRSLPVFSSTRVPSRFLYFVVFGVAVLAGFGLDALAFAPAERTAVRRAAGLLSAAAVGLGGVVLAAHAFLPGARAAVQTAFLHPYLTQAGSNMTIARVSDAIDALLASVDPTNGWTGRGLAALGAAALLLAAMALWPRLRTALAGVLILVAAVDLVLFGRDFHPRIQMDGVLASGPAIDFLPAHNGLHRIVTPPEVWETAPNRLVPRMIEEANGYSSLLPDRHRAYMSAAMRMDSRMLDLMGVRYVVAKRDGVPAPLQAQTPVFQDQEVAIYERPSALPRALVVDAASLAPNGRTALATLQSPGFDPTHQAVVEDGRALEALGPASNAPPGHADVAAYGAQRVVVHASATAPSLLVLADTYYPGWWARVDGRDVPIYRTDYLFRGVPLPPGDHTVVFFYDPPSVKIGGAVSLASGLALLAALAATLPWRAGWRALDVEGDPKGVQPAGA